MENIDVLRKLLNLEKIPRVELDKEVDDYLNYLTQKISWFILNPTKEFYCRDYYKKASKMHPEKSKYIKLKYFYHWKFPQKYKDEEIPEISFNEEVAYLTSGNFISVKDIDKQYLSFLLKRGLIQDISEDPKIRKYIYESTGAFVKFYHQRTDYEFGNEVDSFRIYNLSDKEVIVELEKLEKDKDITMLKGDQMTKLVYKAASITHKPGNTLNEELYIMFKNLPIEVKSSAILVKPHSETSIKVIITPSLFNDETEYFRLIFKNDDLIERTVRLPHI